MASATLSHDQHNVTLLRADDKHEDDGQMRPITFGSLQANFAPPRHFHAAPPLGMIEANVFQHRNGGSRRTEASALLRRNITRS